MYKLNGYVVVKVPDHPHSFSWGNNGTGWVYEHRYVMEVHLGRFLQSDEVVHHKDRDRSNNSVSNLELLSASEHSKLHVVENFGPKRKCELCGAECKSRTGTKREQRYCSVTCVGLSLRRVSRPPVEVLREELESSSFLAIGRKYGVSDNTIRKWLKSS